jgi:hypothetical protein
MNNMKKADRPKFSNLGKKLGKPDTNLLEQAIYGVGKLKPVRRAARRVGARGK